MRIENKIKKDDYERISSQVHLLINKESRLTKRSRKEIKKLLENDNIFLAFDKDKVIGFIARENIYKNYIELKSWFVVPELRNKGVGRKLLKEVISEKGFIYLIATFYDGVISIFKKEGFIKISLLKLPTLLVVKMLFTRNTKSLFKHMFRKKSTLLIK